MSFSLIERMAREYSCAVMSGAGEDGKAPVEIETESGLDDFLLHGDFAAAAAWLEKLQIEEAQRRRIAWHLKPDRLAVVIGSVCLLVWALVALLTVIHLAAG